MCCIHDIRIVGDDSRIGRLTGSKPLLCRTQKWSMNPFSCHYLQPHQPTLTLMETSLITSTKLLNVEPVWYCNGIWPSQLEKKAKESGHPSMDTQNEYWWRLWLLLEKKWQVLCNSRTGLLTWRSWLKEPVVDRASNPANLGRAVFNPCRLKLWKRVHDLQCNGPRWVKSSCSPLHD